MDLHFWMLVGHALCHWVLMALFVFMLLAYRRHVNRHQLQEASTGDANLESHLLVICWHLAGYLGLTVIGVTEVIFVCMSKGH